MFHNSIPHFDVPTYSIHVDPGARMLCFCTTQSHGTGTATIEAKIHQSLTWRDQCPLYQIYIDLKKAYDALDRERMLNIMVAYGVGQKMLALQKHFWDMAKLVCSAGGNYGEAFSAERGVTQGGPLSSLMFNVCVCVCVCVCV
jgi:hypothetical protein